MAGQSIPTAAVPIGDTGRIVALNEYKGEFGLSVGRIYKGSFYLDWVTIELQDGRTFNVPKGFSGFKSKEELVDQLVRLAEKISQTIGGGDSKPKQETMFDDNGPYDDDDVPF